MLEMQNVPVQERIQPRVEGRVVAVNVRGSEYTNR